METTRTIRIITISNKEMNTEARNRAKKEIIRIGTVLLAGFFYALFVNVTGLAVPCVFHLVTGLQCPSCGVTHMFMAMLHLDFKEAFESNQAIFLLLPFIVLLLGFYSVTYIKTGSRKLKKWQEVVIFLVCTCLLLFGIVRNIPGMNL